MGSAKTLQKCNIWEMSTLRHAITHDGMHITVVFYERSTKGAVRYTKIRQITK